MSSNNGEHRTEELLRQALADEARLVEPDPQALQQIRARTTTARARRTGWLFTTLGAAVAVAAVVIAVVLVGGQRPTTQPPIGTTTQAPSPSVATQAPDSPSPSTPRQSAPATQPAPTVAQQHQPSTSAHTTAAEPTSSQPTTSQTTPAPKVHEGRFVPGTPTVTVYYVGNGNRLYAEQHTVSGDTGPVAAVRELLTSTPIDSDYRRPPSGDVEVTGITRAGDTTTVHLAGDSAKLDTFPISGPDVPVRAVWLQEIARTAEIPVGNEMAVTLNGKPLEWMYFTHLPVTVEPDAKVRAWIDIDSPAAGQTVDSPVTVKGTSTTFEGTLNWSVTDSDGKRVRQDLAMGGANGTWGPFRLDIGTLDPGTYTVTVYELSAQDGSKVHADDTTFTVR